MRKYIKTSEYAKIYGISQRTVINNFHKGIIEGKQDLTTKTIYIKNPEYQSKEEREKEKRVILYARVSRVSSSTNKASMEEQIERMRMYAYAKGYKIVEEIKEVGSGVNDNRIKLKQIFKRKDFNILLCEHKDRLTRFGYGYIKELFSEMGVKVESINESNKDKDEEMLEDFISIVTSFCNRIYGRNRKKKTIEIIGRIKDEKEKSL